MMKIRAFFGCNALAVTLCLLMTAAEAKAQPLPLFVSKVNASVSSPVDMGKVMNVARGGQSINSDLAWMPSLYGQLAGVGIRYYRVDWLVSDLYYSVVSRDVAGRLVCDFTRLDKVILPMLEAGIRPIMCMTYLPGVLDVDNNSLPDNWDEYQSMLRAYVEHYQLLGYPGLTWESHNEPEGFTKLSPANTYQMYKRFSMAVKQADSTAVVGGYGAVGHDWMSFLEAFLDCYSADAAPPVMDFFSYHQYGGDEWSDEVLIEQAFAKRGIPLPDIYIDEWNDDWRKTGAVGCSFDNNLNAVYMARKMYLALLQPHVKKICYFNVADNNAGKLFSGDTGAWTVDGRRKAAANVFDFYGRLFDRLVSSSVSGPETATYDRFAFFTKESGRSLAGIAWNRTDSATIARLDFSGLDSVPHGWEYHVDKYTIDGGHGNLYADYVAGVSEQVPSAHELPQIEGSWSFAENSFLITDTLTANSVVFYRVKAVTPH